MYLQSLTLFFVKLRFALVSYFLLALALVTMLEDKMQSTFNFISFESIKESSPSAGAVNAMIFETNEILVS